MLKKISRLSIMCMLFMHSTTQPYTLQDIRAFWKKTSAHVDTGLKVGTVLGVAVGTYYIAKGFYNYVQARKNEKIENEMVEVVTLALTSNFAISKFPENEQEQAFRKKAMIMKARRTIKNKLAHIVADESVTLSPKHRENLRELFDHAKKTFKYIDMACESFLCLPNPYEDIVQSEAVDSTIEDKIIASFIFAAKPEEELTKADLKIKSEMLQRRENVFKKLESRLSIIWIKKIESAIHLLDYLN